MDFIKKKFFRLKNWILLFFTGTVLCSAKTETDLLKRLLFDSFRESGFANKERIVKIQPYYFQNQSQLLFSSIFCLEYVMKEHFYMGFYLILSDFERPPYFYPIGKEWLDVKIPSCLKGSGKKKIIRGNFDQVYETAAEILLIFIDCFQKIKKSKKILQVYFEDSLEQVITDVWNFLFFVLWGDQIFECCIFDYQSMLGLIQKPSKKDDFEVATKEITYEESLYLQEVYIDFLRKEYDQISKKYEKKEIKDIYYEVLEINFLSQNKIFDIIGFLEQKIKKNKDYDTETIKNDISFLLSKKNSFCFLRKNLISKDYLLKKLPENIKNMEYLFLKGSEDITYLSSSQDIYLFFLKGFFFLVTKDKETSDFWNMKVWSIDKPLLNKSKKNQKEILEYKIKQKKKKFLDRKKMNYWKTKIKMPSVVLQNDNSFVLKKKKTSFYQLCVSSHKIKFLIKKYKNIYGDMIYSSAKKISDQVKNKNLINDFRYIIALYIKSVKG